MASTATAGSSWNPRRAAAGFEFVNDIFGGAIPRNFIPAVEKGIIEAAARGYLAGYPVVDFKVILFDGSYHDVDSSEMAFKLAGSKGFKKCMEQAKPCLLEPIMNVEIHVPENYSGDIMGNLNGRRGRIQGMEPQGGSTVVKAQVPAGGNAHLRFRPHVHDPGPRDLLHGNVPLRRCPADDRRQDRRRPQAFRRGRRGRVGWKFQCDVRLKTDDCVLHGPPHSYSPAPLPQRGKEIIDFPTVAPLGERVARRGAFISRGETGDGLVHC